MNSLPGDMAAVPEEFRELLQKEDVARMVRPRGQVLLYAGHYPLGVFVVLAGSLAIEAAPCEGKEPFREVVVTGRPLLLPPVKELDHPAGVCVTTTGEVDMIFVPRTLLANDPSLGELLAASGCMDQSLS